MNKHSKRRRSRQVEGGLYQRGNGRWQVVVSNGTRENGRRRRIYKSFGDKDAAENELHKLLTDKRNGRLVESSNASLKHYIDNYLNNHARAGARTVERWRSILRLQIEPYIGDVKLKNLRVRHLTDLYRALESARADNKKKAGLSKSTIRQVHALIHLTLQFAVAEDGILAHNIAAAVPKHRKPKVELHPVTVLDADELARLLGSLQGRPLYAPVLIAALTGMRRGELLALRWSRVDLSKQLITVAESLDERADGSLHTKKPKSGKVRLIQLDAMACSALEAHRKDQTRTIGMNALVFPTPEDRVVRTKDGTKIIRAGSPWKPSVMSGQFQRAAKRAGFTLHFHQLRHTAASLLIAAGAHLKVVSDRLGHSSTAITDRIYAHLADAQRQEAADLLGNTLRRAQERLLS